MGDPNPGATPTDLTKSLHSIWQEATSITRASLALETLQWKEFIVWAVQNPQRESTNSMLISYANKTSSTAL
jgi:hypothetical protein